ncbi:helix-turn-helix domain-containing protein [Edwardsiella piscicida]|uniref:Helix-turn-helix domain-containing protein n=1 Tax=Edwardsiella piscicida TaxID=1263550 RepID=A0AAQ3C1R0_EDWPI|nr:helix-turn-helix domain-containing protein [Edwardsiella piscicida]MDM3866543.1 helix-turn-helix domain-containing protein [Edwardsiella piscicida]QHR95297.1 hypothetical protein GT752_08485 [Edwardsiella piscicida]UJT82121.1 helix-turn-helix domain-containing protein [Edwardsiella piscicida]UJT85389.1 helix-turn-helix domain-containing protein [Edwardsiella piscicida]WDU90658.1 helix-turn-helix domain-containing protein [Edwardsiella piscicida]
MTLKHSNQLQACCRFLPCIDSVRNTAETLASYAKKTHVGWVCFPKIATLANLAGVSLRTAKYHLKKLVELGVITISHRHYICKKTGRRRQAASLYTFCTGRIMQFAHQLKTRCKAKQVKEANNIAPSNCPPRSVSFRNKQNKGSFGSKNQNQTAFQHTRYAQANRIAEENYRERQAIQCDGSKHLQKIRALFKIRTAR